MSLTLVSVLFNPLPEPVSIGIIAVGLSSLTVGRQRHLRGRLAVSLVVVRRTQNERYRERGPGSNTIVRKSHAWCGYKWYEINHADLVRMKM